MNVQGFTLKTKPHACFVTFHHGGTPRRATPRQFVTSVKPSDSGRVSVRVRATAFHPSAALTFISDGEVGGWGGTAVPTLLKPHPCDDAHMTTRAYRTCSPLEYSAFSLPFPPTLIHSHLLPHPHTPLSSFGWVEWGCQPPSSFFKLLPKPSQPWQICIRQRTEWGHMERNKFSEMKHADVSVRDGPRETGFFKEGEGVT